APLPDVADRLPQPIAVRSEGAHGSRADPAVRGGIVSGEGSLPDVCAPSPVAPVDGVVAPGVGRRLEPATRRALPRGFSGQTASGPLAVGERVGPADVHDRVLLESAERRGPTAGMPPVGS